MRRPGQQVTGSLVEGDLVQIYRADQVTLVSGPVVHSAYPEQVRRIAPAELRDRDAELAELAAFCTAPDAGPYVWWQAPPGAGKSALMSWFVLHPPSAVRVVSFFITARYLGQDDRAAFTDALLEQLADLLGLPMPPYLTERTREHHLLALLAEAARACGRHGERLVLVVDGLDEDRGVTGGPDGYSIAALLPERPPDGLRVIVAGRPHPPLPDDVPDGHPLRDPSVVRPLAVSRWASMVGADMRRELKRLLRGTPAEKDLLGLVTAAGGGLSARDLAELAELPEYEISDTLGSVAGRSFASYPSRLQPGARPDVYVLGHEELVRAAVAALGAERLAAYRGRLHAWAERYRQQGWPPGTPDYLLRGYVRLLSSTADTPRLVALATDPARHDRMRDITGGDAAALTEIAAAHTVLRAGDPPDLHAIARLAVHRRFLADRNTGVPPALPAAWALVGQLDRAESLACAITSPGERVEALGRVVQAAAEAGDHGRWRWRWQRRQSQRRARSPTRRISRTMLAGPWPVLRWLSPPPETPRMPRRWPCRSAGSGMRTRPWSPWPGPRPTAATCRTPRSWPAR
jgi:hypothetical protein